MLSGTNNPGTHCPQPPEVRSAENMRRYCEEYSRWLLLRGGGVNASGSQFTFASAPNGLVVNSVSSSKKQPQSRRSSTDMQAVPYPSSRGVSKSQSGSSIENHAPPKGTRKPRTVEDGTEVWMKAVIEITSREPVNLSEAVELYRHSDALAAESAQVDESRDFFILRYAIPNSILDQFETLEELKIAFCYGLHSVMAKIIHTRSDTVFNIQSIQDKLNFKRKVPVPIIGLLLDYYAECDYLKKDMSTTVDGKITSLTKYQKKKTDSGPRLQPLDLARLAFRLNL